MFDLSWTELMVVAVVAIIFIGPKELPNALRLVGKWTGKARAMARDFQNSVDDMVRESELADLKKEFNKIQSGELQREIEKSIDPKGEIAEALSPPVLPSSPMADTAPVATKPAADALPSSLTPPPAPSAPPATAADAPLAAKPSSP
jgi:sec-independent protein translocase protein TatB